MKWLTFLLLFSCHPGIVGQASQNTATPTENIIKGEDSAVIKVGAANFEREVLQSDRPVISDFKAKWCGPCMELEPIFERTAQKHPEIKFVSIDVDEEPGLTRDYDIKLIPTLIVFKNRKIYTRSGPVYSEAELLRLLY